MEYRKFIQAYVMRLDPGEEIVAGLAAFCRTESVRLASVSGLGAVNEVELGVYDTAKMQYSSRVFKGIFEIASLTGSITEKDGEPYLHLHMVISNPVTGECIGGHLSRAVISATGEVIIHPIDGNVGRKMSAEIGLNLYDFS